jgi:hypothetical protein
MFGLKIFILMTNNFSIDIKYCYSYNLSIFLSSTGTLLICSLHSTNYTVLPFLHLFHLLVPLYKSIYYII